MLADRSLRDAPAVWGRVAVQAYHEFEADRIVAEVLGFVEQFRAPQPQVANGALASSSSV